jgi:hypothetical protein
MQCLPRLRPVFWCSVTLAVLGCAQIAGLTGDYRDASGGSAGAAGTHGGTSMTGGSAGAVGGSSTVGGASGIGGTDAGAGSTDAGAGGTDAGAGGSNGGVGGSSGGAGGSSGGVGGSNGGAGGSSGGAGGSSGGVGAAGSGGSAGGGEGGAWEGPVHIGSSEFHDSSWGTDNAAAHLADASFEKPPGTAAGDLLLIFFGADHFLRNLSGTMLEANGWTLIDDHHDYGEDGHAAYLLYKFAEADEPDPIVIAGINETPDGMGVQGLLSVYRGVNRATPINKYKPLVFDTGEAGVTEAVTETPALTTTTANCLVIAGLSPDTAIDAPVISSWPEGFDENRVSVVNPPYPYPYGWANIYAAERRVAEPSTIEASAFTWTLLNANVQYGALSFVLALAP